MARRAHKRWSQHVTENSNALDLDEGVFSKDDPRQCRAVAEALPIPVAVVRANSFALRWQYLLSTLIARERSFPRLD